jgi:RHS repeat-associated protein
MAKGGRDYLIVGDETGGPRAVIDAQSGVAVQKLEYSGFGMVLSDSGPGFQPFGFAGGVYDGDTSMLHFQFRDYDPQAGRWLSRDPAWFSAESSNLYQYALNDPVNRRDAKGLADSEEHSWWSRIKEIWEAHDWAKKAVEEDTPPGAMEEYRQVGQPAVENLNGVDGLLKRMQALWRKCSNALGGDDSGGQAPRPVDSGAPPRVTPGPRSTPRQWSPDSVY